MHPLLRSLLSVAAALAVMGLAFWAYAENYATRQALRDQRALAREIAGLREAIAMQRAEWAWLNRPDRLAALTKASFDHLALLPMSAESFAPIAAIPAPPPPGPAPAPAAPAPAPAPAAGSAP